jgi:DNA transposition AAA+ family ATPase
MADNDLSQKSMAELADINVSYLNAILTGMDHISTGDGGEVLIKAMYYQKLARVVGYMYEKQYWQTVETDQYLNIYASLKDGKATGRMKMIVGNTGCGKTYTVDKFVRENPVGTYRITVSSLHSIRDILNELCLLLGMPITGTNASKIYKLSERLRNSKNKGMKLIVILDEAENLKTSAIKMLKSLYDGVRDYCSIALIGTPQLVHKLDQLREKNHDGIPQFYRRFKAGIRELPDVKKDNFEVFFQNAGVVDEGLKTLLLNLCDNFGELNDYLEPALREADGMNIELTERHFRLMFGLGRG